MDITPEVALQILVGLVKRAPMSDAESLGAQCAINALEKSDKELKDLKNPPPPKAAD